MLFVRPVEGVCDGMWISDGSYIVTFKVSDQNSHIGAETSVLMDLRIELNDIR